MKSLCRTAFVLMFFIHGVAGAQSLNEVRNNLSDLVRVPAVTGHEEPVAALIVDQLKKRGLSPQTDGMSNVTVTLGSGKPHRLFVAHMDEPGYIVSGITDDGYLRIQRIGTTKPHPYFDQYFEGQRLTIRGADGKTVTGVLAIPSTHLARGRDGTERPFDLSDGYIDVGARSAAAVQKMGIRILDPVSIEKTVTSLAGDKLSGPFVSDRAGVAVLLSILTTLPPSEVKGTVTFAFTAQEHFGRKGLDRMSVVFEPDEVYVLEPVNPSETPMSATPGKAVSVDAQAVPAIRRMLERFEGIREETLKPVPQTPQWKRGTDVVRIGIPIMFYATPVEVLDLKHLQSTIRFLRAIIQYGVS